MEDVLFSEWLKQPGDPVSAGEAVAVIETDKATVELSGLTAGRLSRHLVEPGTRVAAGSTVAFVLAEGESEPGAASAGTGAPLTSARRGFRRPATSGAPPPVPPSARRTAGNGRAWCERRAMAEAASTGGAPLAPAAPLAPSAAPLAALGRPTRALGRPTRPSAAPTRALGRPTRWGYCPAGQPGGNGGAGQRIGGAIAHFSVGRDLRVDGLADAVAAARAAGAAVTVTDFLALGMAGRWGKRRGARRRPGRGH